MYARAYYISVKFDISCYMKHLTAELIYLKERVFVYIIYTLFTENCFFFFKLNFFFAFYHVVYIVHSPWLWSVTSTYFQIRANVFYLFLYRLEIKFSYSYSYSYLAGTELTRLGPVCHNVWYCAYMGYHSSRGKMPSFCRPCCQLSRGWSRGKGKGLLHGHG